MGRHNFCFGAAFCHFSSLTVMTGLHIIRHLLCHRRKILLLPHLIQHIIQSANTNACNLGATFCESGNQPLTEVFNLPNRILVLQACYPVWLSLYSCCHVKNSQLHTAGLFTITTVLFLPTSNFTSTNSSVTFYSRTCF